MNIDTKKGKKIEKEEINRTQWKKEINAKAEEIQGITTNPSHKKNRNVEQSFETRESWDRDTIWFSLSTPFSIATH
jgi:hypothetical protein